MFGVQKPGSGSKNRAGELRQWVRDAHGIGAGVTVMVTELRCHEVGCPEIETVIAVLYGPGDTRQARIPKGIAEVTLADIEEMNLGGPGGTGGTGGTGA